MTTHVIPVPLGSTSYEIVIGAGVLDTLPAVLARTCPAAQYAIIADSQVAEHYGARVRQLVRRQGPVDMFTFPAGEWNKTRAHWSALSDALLAAGAGRDAAIIALGGGVTGDLAGFVAATYLRGIPYVQVPTTLLAMIDSSIGGKTGVDTAFGKNLIGAFHQPRAVVADVATLATLPTPHLAAGLAEAIKHAAIADAAYFDRILALRDELTRRDAEATAAVAARSVEIKVEIVAEDERDRGKRAVLNAGHTMGHAIEAVTGYATLHGEAVGIGLALEAELGSRLGITEPGTDERIRAALAAFGLPVEPPEAPIDDLLDAMRRDKKTRGGAVKFAFLKRIGRMAGGAGGEWTTGASEEAIRAVLAG